MTDNLSDRLAADLAVCDAATEGPWEFEPDRTMRDGIYPAYVFAEHMAGYPICDVTSTHIPAGDEDAEFIATARTALPMALRALQAVMGLHRPDEDGEYCDGCMNALGDPHYYPCPTIKAIWEVYGDEPR